MSWQHLRDEKSTARKPYRCYLCEREIPKGERHRYRVGMSAGCFDAFRMHEACAVHAQGLYGYDGWEGHDPAEFRESLEESRASS